MAGGVSAESVRLQFGECCESQSQCDGVLSVKSDGNDTEFKRRDGRLGDGI